MQKQSVIGKVSGDLQHQLYETGCNNMSNVKARCLQTRTRLQLFGKLPKSLLLVFGIMALNAAINPPPPLSALLPLPLLSLPQLLLNSLLKVLLSPAGTG